MSENQNILYNIPVVAESGRIIGVAHIEPGKITINIEESPGMIYEIFLHGLADAIGIKTRNIFARRKNTH